MIGQTISHYKILEKLGEGGMGVVYKAHDTTLDRDVALKFLPHDLTTSDEERTRFIHEAKAASALDHPNVCTVYEVGQTPDGQMFIAMGYYEGDSLTRKLRKAPLKVEEAVGIAIQIAEGLQAAHEHDIVHRDVKSGNIIVTDKGQVKILDFGLAHKSGLSRLTRTGSTVGTAAYMSPEQARGEKIDRRSDLWSLGVVLYEMVSGKLPFRGDHEMAILYSVVNEAPQPIEMAISDASPELIHVIHRALEKDPAERYQSAADMLIDLKRLRKETSRTGFKPVGTGVRMPVRRRKKMLLMLGAVLVVCVPLIVIWLFSNRSVTINPEWKIVPLQIPLKGVGYPGISGSGDWIVFEATDNKGTSGLYIMNTIHGGPRLVTEIRNAYYVDVSADGGLVSFNLYNEKTENNEGYIVYTNGGTPQQIIPCCSIISRFSPDGKRIGYILGLYQRYNPTPSGKTEFWSIGVDGTDRRREFVDSLSHPDEGSVCFSYSPDGRKIAWLRSFTVQIVEIIIHDLGTGKERQITFDKKYIDELVWTHGNQILYTTNKGGNRNIWMVSADGGNPVQITKAIGEASAVRASADGQKVIYQQQDVFSDFWVVDVATNRSRQITFTEENQYSPKFSPDGRHIAFVVGAPGDAVNKAMDNGVNANPSHLFLMDSGGNNRRQLSFGDEVVSHVTWSPDGKWIAYSSRKVSEPVDSFRTYITDPSYPGTSRYVARGVPRRFLDSARIEVLVGDMVYLVPLEGGAPIKVYDDSTYAIMIQGGKYILFHDRHKGKDLGVWIVDGTKSREEQRQTARLLPWHSHNLQLSGDQKTLYSHRGTAELWRMTLPDGREEHINADFLGVENFYDFSPSWDGTKMIIIKRRSEQKIVMIENLFK